MNDDHEDDVDDDDDDKKLKNKMVLSADKKVQRHIFD